MVLRYICKHWYIIVYSPISMHLNTMTCCFYDCYVTSFTFSYRKPFLQLKSIRRSHFWLICKRLISYHNIYGSKHKHLSSARSESLRYDIWCGCLSVRSSNSNNHHSFTRKFIYKICYNSPHKMISESKRVIQWDKRFYFFKH